MSSRLPKLIAFDLDYTLWDFWIDTHITPPLTASPTSGALTDAYDTPIEFYPDVPAILHRLRDAGVVVAACSRTHAPTVAREALSLIQIPSKPGSDPATVKSAISYFGQLEIYPGSKSTHFKALHTATSLPYSEMLFFDDESRNREVESLGVTFSLVHSGLDQRTFERGLTEWRRRHLHEVVEDAEG
ncbi:hypothetical protein SERLA73DRAFT_184473 [Serpula lacrymans var. lacrymans S7.3]|uniref:Magnesium-dependent phosphatase-1 n=2 Tax=Serpula lacrymans var. lacrymans TaxID=341189 RepID=F8Q3B1_SERL3|nr:uncharacterized protein SERLADRAFT_472177 [Serpula lacrymans var. lacrymans S7.9]EGN97672.1 hypothetical protein SERLA73DRAFT_184473 [Serpula lacrymans var. lacrymans S7.3]EGO23265.1 hypothetical protein SERLADRAFT_472177 [Serpula lacrymans var. lacrymans S7.9]